MKFNGLWMHMFSMGSWMNVFGYLTGYCSSCNTVQNFGLHPILELLLRVSLDDYTHWGSLPELVWFFAPTLLDHSTNKFCMLISMSCLQTCSGHIQGLHFVCTCCVHYVNIHPAHTWSHVHYHANVVAVVQWSITNIVLVAHTIG